MMYARSRSNAPRALDVDLPERYESVQRLASGGMGSVYRAWDRILGRMVAIKLLAEGFADDERAVQRFLREARAAARLSGHPHVITIYDVGDADGRPYLVMEHLGGGTVADALRIGAASQVHALRWIREAALALDHAHGLGVLHRDVKPGNMLLSRDRVLHLADFGIARLTAEHPITGVNEMFGTAAYMSPEQTRGEPATEASDRYALAVAAFELLVGERPFQAEHFAGLARAHQEAPRPGASTLNPRLPSSVDPVLARGMAQRPEERWNSALAFATALEGELQSGAVPSPGGADDAAHATTRRRATGPPRRATPSPPRRVLLRPGDGRPQGRRRPASRAVAIGALAVAAVALAVLLGAGHGSGARRAGVSVPARPVGVSTPRLSGKRPAGRATAPAAVKPVTTVATTPAPTTAPSADGLEARGHQLMTAGEYQTAIPVLRQALQAAQPGSLTYAYALFDLGRSLRLAGDPSAAVPVLEQRLKIPNQTKIVRSELILALQQASPGAPAASPALGGSRPGPGPRDRRAAKQRNQSSDRGD